MRIVTYFLVFVLVFLSIFMVGYLVNNKYIGFWGDNLKGALISRFVEPKEVRSISNLLEKLPSQATGLMTVSNDGQSLIYYDPETGYLHKVLPETSENQDSTLQKLRPFLTNLRWSQHKDTILADDTTETILYKLTSGESEILPQNILFPTLSPSGNKLAYIEHNLNDNRNWLNISTTNLESSKKLLSVASGNWLINWINENTLSLAYNNLGAWSLMEINIENGHLTRLFSNLHNLEINWSPNGLSLLYSYSNKDSLGILAYQNMGTLGGEQRFSIDTSASRCVWSVNNSTIFCPINTSGPQDREDDGFVVLKPGSSPQNLRINNTSKLKVDDLSLSADEKYLFFRNVYTGNFYRLRIEIDQ